MVYATTIIHLSVGENGGYLLPLWWIIVKYKKSIDNNIMCILGAHIFSMFFGREIKTLNKGQGWHMEKLKQQN